MIEGVKTQQVIEQATKAAEAAENTEPQVQQPVGEDLARFEQALGDEGLRADQNPMEAGQEQKISAQDEPRSAGDIILDSFDRLREAHSEKMQAMKDSIEAAGEGETVSPLDMFKVQAQLMEATLQVETAAKVTDKAVQGVSTLLHSQS